MAAEKQPATSNDDDQTRTFNIHRIYTKDLSYESPATPEIFQEQRQPQINLDLTSEHKTINQDLYEVVLRVTVEAKIDDQTIFLVETKEAGIFTIKGFKEQELAKLLGSFCPETLFPYAREIISETISRGNFPPLYLSPINFDAWYQNKLNPNSQVQT
jgi:protein-export chaperone SecB